MPSSTVENYLKRLYLLQQEPGPRLIPMGKLASVMEVTPGTATSMIKALADSGLVDYEPRTGVRLSDTGRKHALRVLRRHRLVELFLVDVLGLNWSEVHEEAEALEHVISDRVLGCIDDYLDHPSVDPHGDPIPSDKGVVEKDAVESLAECKPGRRTRVARILDQDAKFLRFLERSSLTPGTVVKVEQVNDEAGSVTVVPHRQPGVHLGTAAAEKILVEK